MKVSTYTNIDFLKRYENELKARQLVGFKEILKLLGPLKGKRILDIGCGPGNLTKAMADKAATVIGVDKSEKWIDLCNKQYSRIKKLNFIRADAVHMPFLKNDSLDAVVMNMVILNVATLREVESIFKEVSRVLKRGGIFVFSDLHPACIMTPKVFPDRYQKYSSKFSYFKDGSEYIAGIMLNKMKNQKIEFYNRHWTLETYTFLLDKLGLCVFRLTETHYEKDAPRLLQRYQIPEYLFFGCKKI